MSYESTLVRLHDMEIMGPGASLLASDELTSEASQNFRRGRIKTIAMRVMERLT
jgi:hypothetical protein